MLAYPVKDFTGVERNLDLIRDLLLKIEANPEMAGKREFVYLDPTELDITGCSLEELSYHATILIEGGYLKGNLTTGYVMPSISRLTWDGHEFLDNIRDPSIWGKTKERLVGLPGVAISVVANIALAEAKKHLGLP